MLKDNGPYGNNLMARLVTVLLISAVFSPFSIDAVEWIDSQETPKVFSEIHINPYDILEVEFFPKPDSEESAFRLAIGQKISVRYANFPELNQTQFVRPDGSISLPYLGQLYVAGMTVEGLAEDLTLRYAGLTETDPQEKEFKLRIGHEVSVKFVNLPELNEMQFIRPDGHISLPYIGSYPVVDKTVNQLTNELIEQYGKILKSPQLYVVVSNFQDDLKRYQLSSTPIHVVVADDPDTVMSQLTNKQVLKQLASRVMVRADGFATFDRIGDILTAGRTLSEMTTELNRRYGSVLSGVNCSLTLRERANSLIYTLGQVAKPGAHRLVKRMTVLEALELAGNPLAGAKLNNVVVIRRKDGKPTVTQLDLSKKLGGHAIYESMYLQPNDIIYLPNEHLTRPEEIAKELSDLVFLRDASGRSLRASGY